MKKKINLNKVELKSFIISPVAYKGGMKKIDTDPVTYCEIEGQPVCEGTLTGN